jgi:hypothetical protein
MYVYYITVEIYVLFYTNIFSPFYFVYVTIMWYHFLAMDFTQLQIMQKIFENKISIIFTILFHKTLHSYNNLFSSSKSVFKAHKHSFILITKMKLNKKFPNVYISYGSQCDSTCTLMWQFFLYELSCVNQCTLIWHIFLTWIIMCESMHINWSYDQTIIKIRTLIKL